MVGIINDEPQNAGAPPAPQEMEAPGQQPMTEADIDPEEIKVFKDAYQLSKQFFYQEEVFNSLMEEAKANPVKAIAGLTVNTMLRVQEKVGPISLQIAASLGVALMDDLAETLEKAGVITNSAELQEQLLAEGVTLWLQSNDYPPDQVAAAMEGMGAPQEMTQQIRQKGMEQQQPQQPPPQQQQPVGPGAA